MLFKKSDKFLNLPLPKGIFDACFMNRHSRIDKDCWLIGFYAALCQQFWGVISQLKKGQCLDSFDDVQFYDIDRDLAYEELLLFIHGYSNILFRFFGQIKVLEDGSFNMNSDEADVKILAFAKKYSNETIILSADGNLLKAARKIGLFKLCFKAAINYINTENKLRLEDEETIYYKALLEEEPENPDPFFHFHYKTQCSNCRGTDFIKCFK